MPPAFIITGIKAIDRKLRKLPVKVQKKVIRQSMRDGLKVMQAEVKSQIPVDTGLARSNVKVRALKKRRRDRIAMEVRIAAAPGLINTSGSGKPFFYPAGIEYGDSEHQANPFGRRSYTAKGDTAKSVTMVQMRDGVEREAKTS
jgi:Bacteriophage HK97-gp10, putative tail-component